MSNRRFNYKSEPYIYRENLPLDPEEITVRRITRDHALQNANPIIAFGNYAADVASRIAERQKRDPRPYRFAVNHQGEK